MSPRSRGRLFFTLTLLLAAVFVRLGLWQTGRLLERRSANRVALAARSAVPLSLDDATNRRDIAGLQHRRITVTGVYDLSQELVLRGQSVRGVPGVRIVTPLRPVSGDTAILVQRGFMPSSDATTIDRTTVREEGQVQVQAIAFVLPDTGTAGEPRELKGQITWRRVDLSAIRRQLPYPVAPLLALQLPDTALPALPRRDEPLLLDDGPHLSYAVQWFSFALTAIVIGLIIGFGKNTRGARSIPRAPRGGWS